MLLLGGVSGYAGAGEPLAAADGVNAGSVDIEVFSGPIAVTDRHIVRTVEGRQRFRAALEMTLHRHDIEPEEGRSTAVTLTFQMRLIDRDTQAEVALENATISVSRAVVGRADVASPDPVVDTWIQTLEFSPAVGEVIDPRVKLELEVTVAASDSGEISFPVVEPVRTAEAVRFLVLSGKLWFGGVETSFLELSNDPSSSMRFDGTYSARLGVAARSGWATAAGVAGRRFGDGEELDVIYDPVTGDARVVGGAQAFTTTASDIVSVVGVRFVRGPMVLDSDGVVVKSSHVLFPSGFGVSTAQNSLRHKPGLDLGEMRLKDDFALPLKQVVGRPSGGGYFYVFLDRLPLRFRTREIEWNIDSGTFGFSQTPSDDPLDPADAVLVRELQEQELVELTPFMADRSAAQRPSNDGFMRRLKSQSAVVVGVGSRGEASVSAQFDVEAGRMESHFPQSVEIKWTSGRLTLVENVVSKPSYLRTDESGTIGFQRDCDGDCGGSSGPGAFVFSPTEQIWDVTRDGGLTSSVNLRAERLRWGTTELAGGRVPPEGGAAYAHQTSQWTEGRFHVPGTWAAGKELLDIEASQRAEAMLLSGVLEDGSYERPESAGYRAGRGDYAGLNLRVGVAGVKTGRSVLAGVSTADYQLKARTKYYVRRGGVTGIHEASELTPSTLSMYGFPVRMDGLRLAFRDGLAVESKIGGVIHVDCPDPRRPGFDLEFKELSFKCRGQPHRMQLATQGEKKTLAYWGVNIQPLSIEFAQPKPATGCAGVDDGFLLVGVETGFPSITPQKMHAVLGFTSRGNLVTKANPLSAGLEFDSRFVLPPYLQMLGGGGVPWEVTVVGAAYLNNPIPTPEPVGFQRPTDGFLTFPGTINIPWFEDVKVQFHVSSSSTASETTSLVHVMGGWPANPAGGNGVGWEMGGKTYFTDKLFDLDHLAFPPGIQLKDYRNSGSAAYKPRAQKRWLGVVDFDFPLVWDAIQRRFHSENQVSDLLVLGGVERRVQSLSPSTAEITFGVQLGLPRLNAQGLVAAVSEGIQGAVADALTQALAGTALKNQLGVGLAQFDALLSERVHACFDLPLIAAADPVANAVLAGEPVLSQLGALEANLTTLAELGLVDEVSQRLGAGLGAIDATLALVTPDERGRRGLLNGLVRELLRRSGVAGAETLGEAALEAALSQTLSEIDPDLAEVEEVLLRVQTLIQQTDRALMSQVRGIFQESARDLRLVADQALNDVALAKAADSWEILSPLARRDRIRRLISERVMASDVIPKFQYVVRQHVQDANESFRAALDDVFGQVNHLVRAVLSKTIGGLVESRNPAVGDMGPRSGGEGKIAALNIEGYAQINDESLRVLNINGRFEFNVPDALRVQAHLRIQEYDADTPPAGCRLTRGATVAVVEVKANAECDWIGKAGTVVGVGAKFALLGGEPVGFDGYFDFKGEVTVGPITVNEFRLVAGFGTAGVAANTWAYVGGKAQGRFGAYEAAAGIFLGRTCDVEILRMVDPSVSLSLKEARVDTREPITGVYFYGEGWMPLNEVFGIPSTCLLTLKGGSGSGFFAFIGKREPSGKDAVFLGCKQLYGVEGTVLCALTARGTMTVFGAAALDIPKLPFVGAPANEGLFGMASSAVDSVIGGTYVIQGTGTFSVQFGYCPLCVTASRTIGLTWTIAPPRASLGVDF